MMDLWIIRCCHYIPESFRPAKSAAGEIHTAKRRIKTVSNSIKSSKFAKKAKTIHKGVRKGADIILLPGRIIGKVLAAIGKVFHIVGI